MLETGRNYGLRHAADGELVRAITRRKNDKFGKCFNPIIDKLMVRFIAGHSLAER